MKLKEYLDNVGWSPYHFAKITGLHPQTVLNLIKGAKPRADTARLIKKITGNKVQLEIFTRKKRKNINPEEEK